MKVHTKNTKDINQAHHERSVTRMKIPRVEEGGGGGGYTYVKYSHIGICVKRGGSGSSPAEKRNVCLYSVTWGRAHSRTVLRKNGGRGGRRGARVCFLSCLLVVQHVALRATERSADRAAHVAAQVTAPAPHGRIVRGGRDLTLVLLVVAVVVGRVNGVDEGPLRMCTTTTTTTTNGQKKRRCMNKKQSPVVVFRTLLPAESVSTLLFFFRKRHKYDDVLRGKATNPEKTKSCATTEGGELTCQPGGGGCRAASSA